MKSKRYLVVISIFILSTLLLSSAYVSAAGGGAPRHDVTSVNVCPLEHTFVAQQEPYTNYGSFSEVVVNQDIDPNTSNMHGLLKYDLSDIPEGSYLYDATMTFYRSDTNSTGGNLEFWVWNVSPSWSASSITGGQWANEWGGWSNVMSPPMGVVSDTAGHSGTPIEWAGTITNTQWLSNTAGGLLSVFVSEIGASDAASETNSGSWHTGFCMDIEYGPWPDEEPALPTATPMPTIDQYLNVNGCITVPASTARATATVYGTRATPTRTPTGQASATATPIARKYNTGRLTFASDVSPWTSSGYIPDDYGESYSPYAGWNGGTGHDNLPGLARMKYTGVGGEASVNHAPAGALLISYGDGQSCPPGQVCTANGFPLPLRLSLFAKSDPVFAGDTAWVKTYYKLNNTWYAWDEQILDQAWRSLEFRLLSSDVPSGTVTGIAMQAVYGTGATFSGLSINIPVSDESNGSGIFVDDVLLIAGGDATDDNLAGLEYPFCAGGPGQGTGTTGTTVPPKMCVVNITTQDMFKTCTRPTGIDVSEWLSYLWCNISHYFGFYDENRAQVDAIVVRQSLNEPFGSLIEVGQVSTDMNAKVSELRDKNKYQSQGVIEWAQFFMDGNALDLPINFTVPTSQDMSVYMDNCPAEITSFSSSTAAGACMSLYLQRRTIIGIFLQWFLNALFVFGVFMMIRSDLDKLAN